MADRLAHLCRQRVSHRIVRVLSGRRHASGKPMESLPSSSGLPEVSTGSITMMRSSFSWSDAYDSGIESKTYSCYTSFNRRELSTTLTLEKAMRAEPHTGVSWIGGLS